MPAKPLSYSGELPTIAAPATPPGTGAIALVRMSGTKAFAIADQLTRDAAMSRQPRTSYLRVLHDPDGQVVDQAMIVIYPAPASYTGEDVVEFQTHGNPVIVARLLEVLHAGGAQHAEAGAFTRRAMLNGKMGLPEAEALAELIEAVSPQGAAQAFARLKGRVREWAEHVRGELIGVLAQLEAYVDFPDEPIAPQTADLLARRCDLLAHDVGAQAQAAANARIWSQGAKIAIVGPPNVGKSTLLNRLLGEERAIVSPWAGTTRDYLEVGTTLRGVPIQLIDTAGIHASDDPVEQEGIARSFRQAGGADVIIALSGPGAGFDPATLGTLPASTIILPTWNKSDLAAAPDDRLAISAETTAGLDTLIDTIVRHLTPTNVSPIISSLRQEQACREAGLSISGCAEKLREGFPPEIAGEELRNAAAALDRLLGRIDPEDVLDELFTTFCIGK